MICKPIRKILSVWAVISLLCLQNAVAQDPPAPYGAIPTKAQLKWHEMEMYCLIHFGVDTYTDKEWGYGDEDPKLVNPQKFNAEQIVGAAKAGGFKGVVVVAKHHDGLCLWPTKTTQHNISQSNWRGGKGDMIKEYQLACQKLGMQLGLYCSPWDRNSAQYGTPAYVDIYRAQLRELYSNYGKLFISWHDGANGGDGYYGGAREVRKIDRTTYYGWDTTWAITRAMQPEAVLFGDVGPDVRWVGNEEGHAGETSWATYDPQAPDEGKLPANGYTKYELGVEGTRNGKHWMPAECDVSLRPGWFYHASQNGQVKTPYQLLDLYYKSVGRGANLDLGLSPNRDGLLDDEDVASLKKFGEILKQTFSTNLAAGAKVEASNIRGGNAGKFGPKFLLDADRYSYWATDDGVKNLSVVLTLAGDKTFNVIRLRENIKLGQRIEWFAVDAWTNDGWAQITQASSIGANRLIRLPRNITTTKVRLRILKSQICIALSDFGLFKEPVHLEKPVISRRVDGTVSLTATSPVSAIYYTTDGSTPTSKSSKYYSGVSFKDGGILKAVAMDGSEYGEVATATFGLAKSGWQTDPATAKSAIDENPGTFYSTLTNDTSLAFKPAGIIIDLTKAEQVKSISYLPRQDGNTAGVIDKYLIETSADGNRWTKAAEGEFSNIKANPVVQVVNLQQVTNVRYIRFIATHVVAGNGVVIDEVGVNTK